MANENNALATLTHSLRVFLNDRFNLDEGKASERQTIEEIKQGVVFRGANLWILMFAIMVCSVGLNVNSPAVVIGAMLISPLMGPIMGVGLGVGINDFQLIIKALKNLSIAVGISVITSALYFWISPLNDAQSELLARTSPTLWDVLIALFGGLAGIVAGSRKEKSNAIPGVAIATALMPPLCTAGFGLATRQWDFFFGAFYLFFINSVFISLSTYLIVRLLRFKPKEFLDHDREVRVKRYIAIFALVTILPSILTGYNVVLESVFRRNAQAFINTELKFENAKVINREVAFDREILSGLVEKKIEVSLFGEPVSQEFIDRAASRLVTYNLEGTHFIVRQGYDGNENLDLEKIQQMNQQLRTGIIEDLYKKNEELISNKNAQIKLLEEELIKIRSKEMPITDLAKEIKTINQNVKQLSVSPSIISNVDSLTTDTVLMANIFFKWRPRRKEVQQLEAWLKTRCKTEDLQVVVQY
jgi:uncharacterized hydrophobic protein (TIGR00271 family)